MNDASDHVVLDPTATESGPGSLLVRLQPLAQALARNGLTIGWEVRGEKLIIPVGLGGSSWPRIVMSGAYVLDEDQPQGLLRCLLDRGEGRREVAPEDVVATFRTGP